MILFDSQFTILLFWGTAVVFAYSLVGYALLMRCVGRRRQQQALTPAVELPSVTVIIPAFNEETVIIRKIENTLALDYPVDKLQVIVASDGSTDGTVPLARTYEEQGIEVLAFPERRGKTALLNDAVQEADNEVICLCDANVLFRADALTRLVSRLEDRDVGAVSGDVRLASEESSFGEGESTYYRLERTVQLGESRLGSMMGVDGGMYVIRRELFQPLPPDTIVEDFVVSMRLIRQKKRVVLEPEAIAFENGTPTAHNEFTRRVRLSAGAMQALKRGDFPPLTCPIEFWQFVSHKLLRWLGPVWLVVLFVANAALWNDGGIYRLGFAAQILVYAIAAAASFSLRLRETRVGGVAFYFVMSHIAMAVGLVKGLFDMQQVTWKRTERSLETKAAT